MYQDKIKVTYIISDIDKALAFEWIASNIDKTKFDLSFILFNPGDSILENFLIAQQIHVKRIAYSGKKDLPKAFLQILKVFLIEKPDLIHAHLFDASFIGLLAAKLSGIKKRIFTRHHGNQHHVYFPKAVFYDKVINSLATHIVAPSDSVKSILIEIEKVKSSKVKVINHGFDLSYFREPDDNAVSVCREKYLPMPKLPAIGVISRYTELKGLQFIIPAFKKLLTLYPNAHLILANVGGDFQWQIRALLNQLNPQSFTEVVFEPNIPALYKLFDIFVHASIEPSSEAFGQTYVEALAAGVPSVFTLSGVASEFIEDRRNALVVPFKNSDAIFEAMKELLENESLRTSLIEQGKQDVSRKFALSKMIKSLETLYES